MSRALSQYVKTHIVRPTSRPAAVKYEPVLQETLGLTKLAQEGTTVLWLLSDPRIANKVLQPSNFCRGDWCVKDPKWYPDYADKNNPLLILEKDRYLKYLFDTKRGQFKDERDGNINLSELKELIEPFKAVIADVFRAAKAASLKTSKTRA